MHSEDLALKEICDLLQVWDRMRNLEWSGAKLALEERINYLIRVWNPEEDGA